MENKTQNIDEKEILHSAFVQQTLQSWQFFLHATLPPLLWSIFIGTHVFVCILVVFLCGIVWLNCWRLWLDAHYFKVMTVENNQLAGEALRVIWNRKRLAAMPFSTRQQRALQHFRNTLWLTVALWISWLMTWFWVWMYGRY